MHIGSAVPLSDLPEWSQIEPDVEMHNIEKPLYSYFRMPGAALDGSPPGESVFSRAMGKFRDADEQYSRLLWEAKATEPAVFADVTMLRSDDKKKRSSLSRLSNRLFKLLDMGDSETLKEYAPQIRDASQINILNTILRRAEYLCGLAYGTFSDVSSVDKTATEIKASKQRSYATGCMALTAEKSNHRLNLMTALLLMRNRSRRYYCRKYRQGLSSPNFTSCGVMV